MIDPRLVGALMLSPDAGNHGARHLSAASGMVVEKDFLYVIADDQLHLAVFAAGRPGEGRLVRLFPGELPDDPDLRKALKPDLEALVRLPSFEGYPHGALLALASGSRPNRRAGVLLALDEGCRIAGNAVALDLTPFYVPLEVDLPALNVEGAVVLGAELVLLHRGSKAYAASALISFPLSRGSARDRFWN